MSRRRDPLALPLVERAPEVRTLAATITDAASGHGGLVVVEGPAGIGKTRLLAEATAYAEGLGLRTLDARGGVLEQDLSYGSVRLLLERPLGVLTDPERVRVLGGAAALAEPALWTEQIEGARLDTPAAAERGSGIEHGLFWIIANLAETGPLVIVLDDVHWFDAPSLRFLVYLARRVADLPVAMVVGTRPAEAGDRADVLRELLVDPHAVVVRPAPLSVEGVGTVLASGLDGEVATDFAEGCHSVVGGNPFLLTQLVGALVSEGIRPVSASSQRLHGLHAPAVTRTILLRLARLPSGVRELAMAVAVLGDGASVDAAAALGGIAVETAYDAVDVLAAEQILARRLPLSFVHPLVREAIYAELGPGERHRWHAGAAQVLGATGASSERAAGHLLRTFPAGSADVATMLRTAAREATERGAPDIAVRYLSRALHEPPSNKERVEILVELATAGFLAGQPATEVRPHLREALRLLDSPTRRLPVWHLLSRVTAMEQSIPGAVGVLEEALTDLTGCSAAQLAPLVHELCGLGTTHPATFSSAVARLGEAPTDGGATPASRLALANHASLSSYVGRCARRTEELAVAAFAGGRLAEELGPESTTVYQIAFALATVDRTDLTLPALDAALTASLATGSAFGISGSCGTRSLSHFLLGNLPDAEADAWLALTVPALPPFALPGCSAFAVLALVERGALMEAEEVIAASGCGPDLPDVLHMNFALWARARLRAAQGRVPEALADLAEFAARSERIELLTPVIPWRADAALLHARAGDRPAARRRTAEYDELAAAFDTARVRGIAARTRGLLARADEGLELLSLAVDEHDTGATRLEHAHSLAAYGAALRRAGRRTDAVGVLRRADDAARRCRAIALGTRIQEELRTAGVTPRRRGHEGTGALTPSEIRVARMAAAGQTNRQIAETLYVSAKTVENHLGRVYTKLDITSRTALAARLREEPTPSG